MTRRTTKRFGFADALRATLRSLREGDEAHPARPLRGRPIILLQGFAASSRVLLPLERHLRRALGRPVVRLRLGDRIPLHLGDVRASARRVQGALEQIARADGFEYADVIGHSMGGLVATYLLKRLDRGRHVRRVVTLGAPHGGTPLALLGILFLGAITRAVWQMVPGSPLLRELAALPVPAGSRLLAIAGLDDSVVPSRFACLPAGVSQDTHCLSGHNHFELLQSAAVFDCIGRALDPAPDSSWTPLRDAA
jgi:pimeloyl-ACP methyl ester carboxylesterase